MLYVICIMKIIWIFNKMDYEVKLYVFCWIESGKESVKVELLWIICDLD